MSSKFETLEKIGTTPFGVRYRGYNTELNTEAAILELADQYRNNKDYINDIWIRVSEISQLKHDYLVPVIEIDKELGWIITEMRGASLADIVAKEPLPQNVVRTVMRDVLDVLRFFEKQKKVHGDIRPDMLLLPYFTENKTLSQLRCKLGFSLGVFLCGEVLANGRDFKYVAPELVEPKFGEIGTPSDLYSLAFTALELLTGPKFDSFFGHETIGSQATAWSMIHTNEEFKIPPLREMVPDLDDDLFNALSAILKRRADERPQTSEEVQAMLVDTKSEAIPSAIVKNVVPEYEDKPAPKQTIQLKQKVIKPAKSAQPIKKSVTKATDAKPWSREWVENKINTPKILYPGIILFAVLAFGVVFGIKSATNTAKSPEQEIAAVDSADSQSKKPVEDSVTTVQEEKTAGAESIETEPTVDNPPAAKPDDEVKPDNEKPKETTPAIAASSADKSDNEVKPTEEKPKETKPAEPESTKAEKPDTKPVETEEKKPKLPVRTTENIEKFDYVPYSGLGSISPNWKTAQNWEELEKLDESFALSGSDQVTDDDLKALQGLKHLTALNLSISNQLTDAGLQHIKELTQLLELELGPPHLTDSGLSALTAMTSLTKLTLNGCRQIGDEGIKHLAGLNSLKSFLLPGSKITGKSFDIIGQWSALEELRLFNTAALTEASLPKLESLSKLRILDISGNETVTKDAVEKLKAKLPKDCVIIFGKDGERLK